jgi:hypothetical protein
MKNDFSNSNVIRCECSEILQFNFLLYSEMEGYMKPQADTDRPVYIYKD